MAESDSPRRPRPAPSGTRQIVLASHNPGKLREIRQVLDPFAVEVAGLEALGDLAEPEETGLTFAENARAKALYYARRTGQWCLADDSGLAVDALGGEPGVHSARYAAQRCEPGASRPQRDAANIAKLLTAMADVPDPARTARFVCHLALADGGHILLEASGTLEGRIARSGRGENGFGYDPVFVAAGSDRTVAELTAEQKNAISHRGKAVRRFAELLRGLLGGPGGG